MGAGPGLQPRAIGQRGGVEKVAVTQATLPAHSHAFSASKNPATSLEPMGRLPGVVAAASPTKGLYIKENSAGSAVQPLDPNMLDAVGGGAANPAADAHENAMPSVAVNYIIALTGSYPDSPPVRGERHDRRLHR
ncbi:MAG: hypothetical protein Q8L23_11410 [Caulobacter sp.]|nr:hypothetical protein [Caulobacter sp.]